MTKEPAARRPERQPEAGARLLARIGQHIPVARNAEELYTSQMSLGDRVADRLADFAGSWPFILLFLGLVLAWMGLKSLELAMQPWDPYPFVLLNLVLSLLAGLHRLVPRPRRRTLDEKSGTPGGMWLAPGSGSEGSYGRY